MITESEKIAVCAVLGLAEVINGDFLNILELEDQRAISCAEVSRREQIISLRDDIDNLVSAAQAKADEQKARADDLETEINDLKYQVKELAYRIEERRDVRNDIRYKDLKANLGIYP